MRDLARVDDGKTEYFLHISTRTEAEAPAAAGVITQCAVYADRLTGGGGTESEAIQGKRLYDRLFSRLQRERASGSFPGVARIKIRCNSVSR